MLKNVIDQPLTLNSNVDLFLTLTKPHNLDISTLVIT